MLRRSAFLSLLLLAVPAIAAPFDKLQDTFGGASIDTSRWTVKLQSYGSASESGGTLNLVPNANTGSSLIIVSSASTWSLAGSQVAVEASSVPSTAGSVDVQFSLLIDNKNYLQWYCESGFLYAFWAKGGVLTQVARLDYSAAAHAWWRIRESAGTVYWETSADGAVYSAQGTVATSTLFAISSLQAKFVLETYGAGLANPGQASFANFNVAPSGIQPVASLVDPFDGTSLASAWAVKIQTQGSVSESGGSLNLAPDPYAGSSQLMVTTARPYSLGGAAAQVQARTVVSAGGGVNNSFAMRIDGSNNLQWWFESGTLYAFYAVNGVRTTAAQLTYDPVQHAWWRIREASGTVYWDTSPDGTSWTTRGSVAGSSLFSLAMLFPEFYAETWGGGSPSPGLAQYAHFNDPPVLVGGPPAVRLLPGDGATVAGLVLVQPNCRDGVAVASCTLAIDGATVASSASLAFYDWDTRKVADGPHTLQVTATNTSGSSAAATAAVQVANAPRDAAAAHALDYANRQLAATSALLPTTLSPSKTQPDGTWITVANTDQHGWTQGFFPGENWYVYDLIGDAAARSRADQWTRPLEVLKTNTQTHDEGFTMYSSYGHAWRTTGDTYYRDVLLTATGSLATRYDPVNGVILSWNWNPAWHHAVIVDNLMNIELLLWGAQNGGPQSWRDMAVSHALKTLNDFVRPDGSTYHVVDYSDAGAILFRGTQQGYADWSTWTRGQAWAIDGFTLVYRYTSDPRMLAAARKVADYYLSRIGTDWVPNWDFDAPTLHKDSSAAAVVASGLFELSGYVGEPDRQRYLEAALEIVDELSSPAYLSEGTSNQAILLHGTANVPGGEGIDAGLAVGDHYFLEALARRKASR
jgi:hypothetical protein